MICTADLTVQNPKFALQLTWCEVLLIALAAFWVAPSLAQSYPSKPVRLIVPYAAGGAADTIGGIVSQKMSQELGQSIVVENRAGADGNIGAEAVARAAPDGYTILIGDVGNMTMGPAVRRSTPFDPVRDFTAITLLVAAPNIFAVHPSVPANTFRDFIAYAKANPGKLSYASSGTGGSAHLSGELLKKATGIDIVHIAYKGASAAIVDVLRGEVQAMFGLSVVLPHVKEGKLRALATTALRRTSFLPQVPAIAEMGYPDFEATAWYGFLAPAGTPIDIVRKLNGEFASVLNTVSMKDVLAKQGLVATTSTPEEFATLIRNDLAHWAKVIKETGISVD